MRLARHWLVGLSFASLETTPRTVRIFQPICPEDKTERILAHDERFVAHLLYAQLNIRIQLSDTMSMTSGETHGLDSRRFKHAISVADGNAGHGVITLVDEELRITLSGDGHSCVVNRHNAGTP